MESFGREGLDGGHGARGVRVELLRPPEDQPGAPIYALQANSPWGGEQIRRAFDDFEREGTGEPGPEAVSTLVLRPPTRSSTLTQPGTMNGLVDYGSDSDNDSSGATAPSTTAPPSQSTSSFLSLPPPKSSLSLPAPSASTSQPSNSNPAPPAKRAKGPVRILLDLPPPSSASTPSNAEADGPARKKAKLSLGSGGGLSGLAAMLPKPVNESVEVKLEKALAVPVVGAGGSTAGEATKSVSTGFVPYSMTKGKKAAAVAAPPAIDFFGLGTSSPTPSLAQLTPATGSLEPTPTPSTSSITPKPSLTISSAPSLAVPAPPTPTGPTEADPYPGFVQLPSGQWVAKDQETYDLWVASLAGVDQESAPRGFGEREMGQEGVVDVVGGVGDWNKGKQAARPGREEEAKKALVPKGVRPILEGRESLLMRFGAGGQDGSQGEEQGTAFGAAQRCCCKSGGVGGEDRAGTSSEEERGEQVW